MPAITHSLLAGSFVTFLLVLARMSGMISLVPLWGGPAIPYRVRGLLAAALSLAALPLCANTPARTLQGWPDLAARLAAEAGIGLAFGLGIALLLSSCALAGQLISQLSGWSLADLFDPALNAQTPVLSQLLHYLAIVLFLVGGGHRLALEGMLDSLAALPPGGSQLPLGTVDTLTTLLAQSFFLAVRIAAPAVTALVVATLLVGVVSRTLPQLNILAVGLGINGLLTAGVLLVSLGTVCWAVVDSFPDWFVELHQLMTSTKIKAPH